MVVVMIFDKLKEKISEMETLRSLETRKNNKIQQDKTDAKYKDLVKKTANLTDCIWYAKTELGFTITSKTLDDINNLLSSLKNSISTGYAELDSVNASEDLFKNILKAVRIEWNKYYITLSSATIGTLKIISGIDKLGVQNCLSTIKNADSWPSDKKILIDLNDALSSANKIILNLNMDDNIRDFLEKMNNGAASVSDLDDGVLKWLKEEDLTYKIRLSFLSK